MHRNFAFAAALILLFCFSIAEGRRLHAKLHATTLASEFLSKDQVRQQRQRLLLERAEEEKRLKVKEENVIIAWKEDDEHIFARKITQDAGRSYVLIAKDFKPENNPLADLETELSRLKLDKVKMVALEFHGSPDEWLAVSNNIHKGALRKVEEKLGGRKDQVKKAIISCNSKTEEAGWIQATDNVLNFAPVGVLANPGGDNISKCYGLGIDASKGVKNLQELLSTIWEAVKNKEKLLVYKDVTIDNLQDAFKFLKQVPIAEASEIFAKAATSDETGKFMLDENDNGVVKIGTVTLKKSHGLRTAAAQAAISRVAKPFKAAFDSFNALERLWVTDYKDCWTLYVRYLGAVNCPKSKLFTVEVLGQAFYDANLKKICN